MSDGSFGETGEVAALDEDVVKAIVEHRFKPLRKLMWRNSELSFVSTETLIQSLDKQTESEVLVKAREADDFIALKTLSQSPDLQFRINDKSSIKLLWDVCRTPDFRGISSVEHSNLLEEIFKFLYEFSAIPDDWFGQQIKRLDRTDGDIDVLSKRLAFIRTWTYVAQRQSWLHDVSHWRGVTRALEDRLSDALHERLTQRFVDRRTSVLLRRLKQKEALLAEVNENGEVTVEGEFVGKLEGFRFKQDKETTGQEAKTIKSASLQALLPHFNLRADRLYNAPDTEIDFTEQGGLMWGDQAVGKLITGDDIMHPKVAAFVDSEAGMEVLNKVERRLQHFVDRKISLLFEPLVNLQKDGELTGLAKGFGFQLFESLGILRRQNVLAEVKSLDQDARALLRKGVRFGQFTVFMPLLLKPAPTRLRLVLWALSKNLDEFPEAPPPGLVTVPVSTEAPEQYDDMAGYRNAGDRAIRIDMLERLADLLRAEDSRNGFEANADMLSITGMTQEQFANLMEGLGYSAEKGEREKVKVIEITDSADVNGQEKSSLDPQNNEVKPQADKIEGQVESVEEKDIETFYTFKWINKQTNKRRANKDKQTKPKDGETGKSNHKKKTNKKQRVKSDQPKSFESRPEKTKKIDPDNPFAAALMDFSKKN